MFARRIVDPTSKRAFFSNAAILVFVGLIGSFLVVPLVGMASGPTVTPPVAKQLAASTPDQDPGDFILTGFADGDLLVTVGLENPPTGTNFSIGVTATLTRSYGYNSFTNVTEVSFVASSTGGNAMARANAALASMTVSTGANPGRVTFKVSAMPQITGFAFNPVNQSFYKVSSSTASWNTAKAAAEQQTYDGVNGYLATITSAQENTFITNNILGADNIWIGASDAAVEQTWRWVTGPEAGTQFWQGYGGGATVNGQFASWATGEPNGPEQDYALTNWQQRGLWDDQAESTKNLYLIEFSQTVSQSFVNLKSASVTHNFPLPTITPPSTTDILAPGSSTKVNKFVVNGYGPDTRVRVSIKLLNQPTGTTLSIGTTSGLTLSEGFLPAVWTGFSEVIFVGKQADINAAFDNMNLITPAATGDNPPITGVVDIEVTTSEVVDPIKADGDGDIAFNPENGHYYQFIAGQGITFTSAKSSAKLKKYLGLSGYLVTITNQSENDFVSARIAGATNVWIGASDARVEGTWEWVDGPEANTAFWSGKAAGSAVEGRYSSWATNDSNVRVEPNDFGSGEDYAVTNWGGKRGLWNDLPNSAPAVNGYVVEFSGVSDSAPPVISEIVRYSIGMKIAQTNSQATLTYPIPTECQGLTVPAVDGTCTSSVTATKLPVSNPPVTIVVSGCLAAGPCVVPLDDPGDYNFEVEFVKVDPAHDVLNYAAIDATVASADSCRAVPNGTCTPQAYSGLPAESYTVSRTEVSASTTRIDLPFDGVTPPAEPGPRLGPTDFEREEEETLQPRGGSIQQPVVPPVNPDDSRPRPGQNENQQIRNPSLVPPSPLVGPVAPPSSVPDGGSAQIGGRQVEVESRSTSERDLSVSAGDVNLNINVPTGSGGVNNSGTAPELQIKRDKEVALEGAGMLPGSTVQVWLPGSNKNTELGRITVGADGSFSGDVSFGSAPDGSPLPIGSQIIQLTGVDRNGNQTVINLKVNIAQPDPAPELFRGQTLTPQPGFGNFEASNAGLPEQATLTAITDQKQALVEGDGWSLSLQLSGEASGITENADGVFMTLVRGEAASFGGNGFMPGTIASIWLFSDPIMLGEVTIAADGSFSGNTAPLDAAVATGEHTIQIQGVGEDGFIRSANLGVVVADPAAAAAPFAFFDWLPLLLLGVLTAAGLVFAIVARRRKKADGSNVIQFPQAA